MLLVEGDRKGIVENRIIIHCQEVITTPMEFLNDVESEWK